MRRCRLVGVFGVSLHSCRYAWAERAKTSAIQNGCTGSIITSGLDESIPAKSRELRGHLVNLFDLELRVQNKISIKPATRWFLLDLDKWVMNLAAGAAFDLLFENRLSSCIIKQLW